MHEKKSGQILPKKKTDMTFTVSSFDSFVILQDEFDMILFDEHAVDSVNVFFLDPGPRNFLVVPERRKKGTNHNGQ